MLYPNTQTIEEDEGFYTIIRAKAQTMIVWATAESITNLGKTKILKDRDVWIRTIIGQHRLSRGQVNDDELDNCVEIIKSTGFRLWSEAKLYSVVVHNLPLPTESAIGYCMEKLRLVKGSVRCTKNNVLTVRDLGS